MTNQTTTPRKRTRKSAPAEAPTIAATEEGFLSIHRTAYGKDEQTLEKIRVPDLAAQLGGIQPARVRIGGGITRNLGDYNSARVEVMIELPCLPEISECRRVADLISAQLDELIPGELEKAMAESN